VLLLFLALTGLPILATVFVADARGNEPAWALLAPIGVITAISVALGVRLLMTLRPERLAADSPPRGRLRVNA